MATYFVVQYKDSFSDNWVDDYDFNVIGYDTPQIALNEAIKYMDNEIKLRGYDEDKVRVVKVITEIVYSY